MCRDIGDSSPGFGWRAAGFAVADVFHSWRGTGVFDEYFALEVGNDDRVAVGGNDDLLEGVSASDIVGDCTQRECAVAA